MLAHLVLADAILGYKFQVILSSGMMPFRRKALDQKNGGRGGGRVHLAPLRPQTASIERMIVHVFLKV